MAHFHMLPNTLNSPAILKLLRFLNLNWTRPPIPPFTFSLSSAALLTTSFKALFLLRNGDVPAVFPWLSVAFVGGFRAIVGQCHPVFQAGVTSTIEWEEGSMARYGGVVVVIICAYEQDCSSLVSSSWQLL